MSITHCFLPACRYGGFITNQLRRLGASCDWSRERFTLDQGLSEAVATAFMRLHEEGLIYRGAYMVNWSPKLGTAVSDLEVEYSEEPGYMYYFKCVKGKRASSKTISGCRFGFEWRHRSLLGLKRVSITGVETCDDVMQGKCMIKVNWSATDVEDQNDWHNLHRRDCTVLHSAISPHVSRYPIAGSSTGEFLPVATTRPETILGDTAVAVHPEDERYKHLVGLECEVPMSSGRKIKVIADEYVDMEFGTGALKITPGRKAMQIVQLAVCLWFSEGGIWSFTYVYEEQIVPPCLCTV